MLITDKQLSTLKDRGSHIVDERGDDYTPVVKQAEVVPQPVVDKPDVTGEKLETIVNMIKAASGRPVIHVEPKVIIEKPKSWVFTVEAHEPGAAYKVKAEAVETL